MITSKPTILLIALVALAAIALAALYGFRSEVPADDGATVPADLCSIGSCETATVDRVIDGDTLDVITSTGTRQRVRILGIDTPETVHPDKPVECMGPEASAHTAELAPSGTTITLITDHRADAWDDYNRRLAHVVIAETNLAHELLVRGLARATTFPHSLVDTYADAEVLAQRNHLGMWSQC